MELLGKSPLYGDDIGEIEQYDFSTANRTEFDRILAVTTVASVCYNNPKAVGNLNLYNRLQTESKGLPSSSYEFVPVLLTIEKIQIITDYVRENSQEGHPNINCIKYGEVIAHEGVDYALTNLRALISDVGDLSVNYLNTQAECNIIKLHFKVFKAKVPLFVARQYMRHRVSWQELSRRYVSGKKQKFEFFNQDLGNPKSWVKKFLTHPFLSLKHLVTNPIKRSIQYQLNLYDYLICMGWKPQDARMVLPQNMYTTVWSAWMPKQLDEFFKLRLDSSTQSQTRQLAQEKCRLLDKERDDEH